MRPATEQEIQIWDQLILKNPDGGEVLQTRAWGEFKGRHGWKPRYFIYKFDSVQVAAVFLTRRVAGFGELWYCPKGPGVATTKQLLQLAKMTGEGNPDAFLIKLEPEIIEDEQSVASLESPVTSLEKPAGDVHISRATIRVNLAPGLDELMANLKQKTRYNVRLAARKGVTVEPVPATKRNLDRMYELMRQTQDRAGFRLRAADYFQDYWKAQAEAGQGQLFFAKHKGRVLAGAFVTLLGNKAWYKDGGSSREHSELMAPYLLQWEIMRWLKAKGIRNYDLVGVSPQGTQRFSGLDHFKGGFGGQAAQFIGTWDLPIDEGKYHLWTKIGEKLTLGYYNRIKKSLWY